MDNLSDLRKAEIFPEKTSTKYHDFHLMKKGNRDVSKGQVKKKKKSILRNGNLTSLSPIIVSKFQNRYVILDGQHRFTALKELSEDLGYDIPFVYKEIPWDSRFRTMTSINSENYNYTIRNYVQQALKDKTNPNYKGLKEVMDILESFILSDENPEGIPLITLVNLAVGESSLSEIGALRGLAKKLFIKGTYGPGELIDHTVDFLLTYITCRWNTGVPMTGKRTPTIVLSKLHTKYMSICRHRTKTTQNRFIRQLEKAAPNIQNGVNANGWELQLQTHIKLYSSPIENISS